MNTTNKRIGFSAVLIALGIAAAVLAWSTEGLEPAGAAAGQRVAQAAAPTRAVAVLYPTEGSEVRGVVTFTVVDDGVRVVAEVENLSAGSHGFHIHELGDCSAPDASSAGGHFNPDMESHGGPLSEARHVGDLGNIQVDAQGRNGYDWTDTHIALEGSHSIIGRSVVIRAEEDDFTSQPDGAAGVRLACGVIGIASTD